MRRAHQDFDEAFEELFAGAYRIATRITGATGDSEDIAAEACARAFAHWGKIAALPYRKAWVLRVAANLAVDTNRRGSRLRSSTPLDDVGSSDEVDTRLALRAALRALPRRQRESVALRYLGGLSERDVAEALGVSTGAVKQHVSRGLAALRMHTDQWEVDGA